MAIKTKIEPKEWSHKERLNVIADLSRNLLETMRLNPANASAHAIFDVLDRIEFIASAGSAFLMKNQESILNGQ